MVTTASEACHCPAHQTAQMAKKKQELANVIHRAA